MKSKRSLHVCDCIDILRSTLHALESGEHGKTETPMPLGYQDLLEILGEKYDSLMGRRDETMEWTASSKVRRVKTPKARLDYLSSLTLQKQIAEFELVSRADD